MIIVTTKTETHFLNEKDFQEIEYHKDVHQVTAFRHADDKHPQGRRTIPEVLSVRYVTDATQMDGTEVDPELPRENLLLRLQIDKLEHHADYMRKQRLTQTKAIEDIYQMSTSKDVNHKTAREHITKLCEKCISECEETYNEARKNGWI